MCGADDLLTKLTSLIDNNLIRQEEQPAGEPRLMLLETIQAYALERLDQLGEGEKAALRHSEYFLTLAELVDRESWFGPIDWSAYERELGNFRAALAWLDARDASGELVRLAASINFYRIGQLTEGWKWIERALARSREVSKEARARALGQSAILSLFRRETASARTLAENALLLYRDLGDRLHEGSCLWMLSEIATDEGDDNQYQAFASSAIAIFRELGAEIPLLGLLHDEGLWAMNAGDYGRARTCLEEELTRAKALGATDEACNSLSDLGVLALYEQRADDALHRYTESLELALLGADHVLIPCGLEGAGCALGMLGHVTPSARLLGAAEALRERLAIPIDAYAVQAYEDGTASVRRHLTEAGVAKAWANGRTLSETDAASYALEVIAELASPASRA